MWYHVQSNKQNRFVHAPSLLTEVVFRVMMLTVVEKIQCIL